MKTITIKLLLLAIPVIMMACNSPSNRTTDAMKNNKKDNYANSNDSVNKNAVAIVNNNDQNKD